MGSCPPGQHKVPGSASCIGCHSSCATCSGPGPAACTSCSSSAQLRDGFCSGCEDGFYLSTSSAECVVCHSSCSTCTGPDPDQCLTCSGELQLDSWSSICVPCCSCGPKGLCTSPTRAARSPMLSSASFGSLLAS